MWGQSKDLEKIYRFYGKMCEIYMKSMERCGTHVKKVWNLHGKCMESMWKRYGIHMEKCGIHMKNVWNKYSI